jgi:hypothetical protein
MSRVYRLDHPAITDLLPRRADGEPISTDTLRGWIQRGVNSRSGERVKLKAMRVGGRYYCCPEYVREFLDATGAAAAEATAS